MKSFQIALLLALLLPVMADVSADSRPSKSSSFKSGFSSQKSSPTSSNRSSSRSSSYGGYGSRQAAPPPSQPSRNSGFGTFGNQPRRDDSAPMARKSDSALSQSISKRNAEENALRTLDARRAAQEAARAPREIRPVPSGPLPSNGQYDTRDANNGRYGNGGNGSNGGAYDPYRGGQYGGSMPMPAPQQNGGLMNVITGFMLGRAANNSHAGTGNNGSYHRGTNANANANANNSGMATAAGADAIGARGEQAAPKGSFMMSVLRTMAWLALLAVLGWLLYFGWKFLRRGKAPSAANYSFERN